jgi:hypothetical protein
MQSLFGDWRKNRTKFQQSIPEMKPCRLIFGSSGSSGAPDSLNLRMMVKITEDETEGGITSSASQKAKYLIIKDKAIELGLNSTMDSFRA